MTPNVLVRVSGILCALLSSTACGATFNLLGLGPNVPTPLVFTVDGIQLRLTGGLVYNSSSTTFGMDTNTSGGFVDDPNLIDGNETLNLFFNQDVILDSITISQYDNQDSGELLLKGVTTFPLSNGTINVGGIRLHANSSDYRVVSNIGPVAGGTRGFSLDRISVRAVPEPAAMLLAVLALVTLTLHRKPSRRRASR
jgi:MYXO-CTERM domain-containing protein